MNLAILPAVFFMKFFTTIFFLLLLVSCKREVPDYPETIEPNTLTLQSGNNLFKIPVTGQLLTYSGEGDLSIIAAGPDIEMRLQARSFTHSLGAGNYVLYCCENEVLEKFSGGQFYDGIQSGTQNNLALEKGSLTITNINSKGYWGRFTFNGQNTLGEEKEFTGTFRVVY
jgi:hypothetical protein